MGWGKGVYLVAGAGRAPPLPPPDDAVRAPLISTTAAAAVPNWSLHRAPCRGIAGDLSDSGAEEQLPALVAAATAAAAAAAAAVRLVVAAMRGGGVSLLRSRLLRLLPCAIQPQSDHTSGYLQVLRNTDVGLSLLRGSLLCLLPCTIWPPSSVPSRALHNTDCLHSMM